MSTFIKGDGARQISSLSRIDVLNFSQKDHFGFGIRDSQVPLVDKVEVRFLLLTHLVRFVVDENIEFGRSWLCRTSNG